MLCNDEIYWGGNAPSSDEIYWGKIWKKNVKMIFTWYGVEKCPYVVMKYIGGNRGNQPPPKAIHYYMIYVIYKLADFFWNHVLEFVSIFMYRYL